MAMRIAAACVVPESATNGDDGAKPDGQGILIQ